MLIGALRLEELVFIGEHVQFVFGLFYIYAVCSFASCHGIYTIFLIRDNCVFFRVGCKHLILFSFIIITITIYTFWLDLVFTVQRRVCVHINSLEFVNCFKAASCFNRNVFDDHLSLIRENMSGDSVIS